MERTIEAPARTRAITESGPQRLQAKLLVGGTDDPAEHEADAIADQVTTFLASGRTSIARQEMRPPTATRIRRAGTRAPSTSARGGHDWTAPAAGRPREVTVGSLSAGLEVIHRWPWSKKKEEPKKPEISGPIGIPDAARPQGWAGGGQGGRGAPPPLPPRPNPAAYQAQLAQQRAYGGPAGKLGSSTAEKAKPSLAIGASGAAAVGTMATHGAAQATGAFGATLSPILMGDAAYGLYNAGKMRDDGSAFGDEAMSELGTRKYKDQGAAFVGGAIGAAKAGVDIGKAASSAASTVGTLGAASGALGIVAGGAMVMQGAWRGGKAIAALCRLSWGRGAEMLSREGQIWKEYVQGAERMKVAVNATKIAIGALGIAAGALLIASNPIGWAIGIAAAVAGGIYAITKIANKISNAKDKEKAAAQIKAGAKPEQVAGPDAVPEDKATPDKKANRKKAIEAANKVSRLASDNAHAAGAMRQALLNGNKDLVQQYLDAVAAGKQKPKGPEISGPMGVGEGMRRDAWVRERDPVVYYLTMMTDNDKRFHDALLILSAINVDYDTAVADSGQDLIEKKLSTTENM